MDTNPYISDSLNIAEIFKGFTDEQSAGLLKKGLPIKLPAGRILFHQGDPATSCFLVNRGCLKLTKLNEQGKEVILRYIGVGEMAAAITLLKGWDYPVTAQSIEETEVTGWDKPTMIQLMHQYPDMAINLLGIVLARIADVQDRYLEVCTERVDQRIARSLLRLMRRAGVKTGSGIQIDIPLSRQNIADYSGTTLYTVSRTLSAWEKIGWIKSKREQIVITDPHALVQFAENG
ncbi:MAG: Crp/Fnr family transcriptional regulator [Deltaproteobacteria bacterium]|nr:Crp/Fnr family transcriptional regulator [Deltaproteobacteria bacterium]